MSNINFRALDASVQFKYRDDWQAAAKRLGYKYISEAIIKSYESMPSSEIAKAFSVSKTTVLHYLRRFGVPRRSKGGPNFKATRDSQQVKKLLQKYFEDELSIREAAATIGMSYHIALNIFKQMDVKKRSKKENWECKRRRKSVHG